VVIAEARIDGAAVGVAAGVEARVTLR
jgi:hypothetical protein